MLAHMAEPVRIEPGPGQESVWDYPRPPRVELCTRHLVVELAGVVIADSTRGLRVLETSQAPAYYFPPADVALDHLVVSPTRTFCEWKGEASYVTVEVGDRSVPDAGWTYRDPRPDYVELTDHLAFYPQRVDACFVDGERVEQGAGDFYGGWITSQIVGPFKGAAGTLHW
jgi:uncharacterized protein (DUF427 family)